jgi:hypothetical protein
MKKNVLLVLLAFSPLVTWAASRKTLDIVGRIGPATSTSNVTISTSGVQTASCLYEVTVISTQAYTFRLLSGGVTTYALSLPANTGFTKDFPIDDPFCAEDNQILEIKVSTTAMNINYSGVVIKRN